MATKDHNRKNAPASNTRAGITKAQPADDTQVQLDRLLMQIRIAMSAVIVCVGALRRQNADMDEEIALVLQRAAGDRLGEVVEELEDLLLERHCAEQEGNHGSGG